MAKQVAYNMDCMEAMRQMPDKAFDLAIVDPPYGLGDRLTNGGHKKNPMEKYRKSYEQKRWDVAPNKDYFAELFRVSVNQIIWGGIILNCLQLVGFCVGIKCNLCLHLAVGNTGGQVLTSLPKHLNTVRKLRKKNDFIRHKNRLPYMSGY